MAKRGENIYKRADGRWEGRYGKGRGLDGKLMYGYIYSRKYGECKRMLDQAKAQHIHVGKPVGKYGSGKVSDFLEHWLFCIAKPHVKESTFSNYYTIVQKWLLPHFGEWKLHKVERREVQCFVSGLLELKLSPGAIRNIYGVLQSAAKKAQEYGYIVTNFCEGIRLPMLEKKESRQLTLDEQKLLEQVAKKDKYGCAILLANYTGLRVGELCGLTWQDIDFDHGVIRVSRTVKRVQCWNPQAKAKTRVIIGTTKSAKSARSFPLPSVVLELLREHRNRSNGTYVFEYKGHPLEPRILQYRFQVLLQKAGLPHIHFHGLRHTFATRCIELSFDIKTLSEILGHSSAKMTLDRYGHSQMEHKRMAMESLNTLFTQPI